MQAEAEIRVRAIREESSLGLSGCQRRAFSQTSIKTQNTSGCRQNSRQYTDESRSSLSVLQMKLQTSQQQKLLDTFRCLQQQASTQKHRETWRHDGGVLLNTQELKNDRFYDCRSTETLWKFRLTVKRAKTVGLTAIIGSWKACQILPGSEDVESSSAPLLEPRISFISVESRSMLEPGPNIQAQVSTSQMIRFCFRRLRF